MKLFEGNAQVMDRHGYDDLENLKDLNLGSFLYHAFDNDDEEVVKEVCLKTYTDMIWTVVVGCYQISLEKMDLLRQSLIKTRSMIDKDGTKE